MKFSLYLHPVGYKKLFVETHESKGMDLWRTKMRKYVFHWENNYYWIQLTERGCVLIDFANFVWTTPNYITSWDIFMILYCTYTLTDLVTYQV